MDELVDVLNDEGKKTGEIVEKLKAHKDGICHGISAIALINTKGNVLLQKRALIKRDAPGKWDLSAAGHITSGDTPKEAAVRETFEEIGIEIKEDELELVDTFLYNKKNENKHIKHYTYLYVIKKDITEDMIVRQETEVDEVKFVNKKEYIELLESGKMAGAMVNCDKVLDYMA